MPEGWQSWLMIGAIGILLVFNIISLGRINSLQDEVDNLQSLRGDVMALQSDQRATHSRIEEIQREQAWVTSRSWTVDDGDEIDCRDEVPVQADWSFRDLTGDPDVRFEYREQGEGDWTGVDASAVGELDYRAIFEASLQTPLEHRIVATSGEDTRSTSPEPVHELAQLADRALVFEHGESRSQEGTRWTRFMIDNLSAVVSPCNEIVAAEIAFHDDGEVVQTVEMEPGHPGDHEPEGYAPDEESGGAGTPDDAVVPAEAEEMSGPAAWWTDWVEWTSDDEPVATVEFRDGSTRTLDRMGTH